MVGSMNKHQRWYNRNREDQIVKAIARQAAFLEQNTRKFIEYFKTHPCVDCEETDPLVLDFDHDDPKKKLKNISKMRANSRWETILKEIEKCQVRCANCHRRRTHQQWNSLKYQIVMAG